LVSLPHLRGRLRDHRQQNKYEEVRHGLPQIPRPSEGEPEWLSEYPEADEYIPDVVAAVALVSSETIRTRARMCHGRGRVSMR